MKAAYVIIAILTCCYVVARTFTVDITYDEVWTINEFVPQSIIHILNYTPCDANNHIINTLLIKLLLVFGNHSLWVARLPNVLAFVMYLLYSYKITSRYLSPFVGIACFLLLLLNPFLLDFFSIARGYGLSLGFLLASIYYTLQYANEAQTPALCKAIGLGAIGVLCNFSLLNYAVSLVCVVNITALFLRKKIHFKTTFLCSLLVAALLTTVVYEPIRKLKQNGNLYYGGNTSFYSDTLVSLAKYCFYSPETNSLIFYSLNVFLFILILTTTLSFFYKDKLFLRKNIVLSITILCIFSVIIQHYLLDTLYLIDRTALFFYPLFILVLSFSFNSFLCSIKNWIIALIAIVFSVNFFYHANLYKTAIWYFDAHTSTILNTLNEKGKKENKKLKIDFSWPFESSIAYYTKKNEYPFIEIVKNKSNREDLNAETDYYLYLTKSLEKVGYDANAQKIITLKKDTTLEYKPENILVFENINK